MTNRENQFKLYKTKNNIKVKEMKKEEKHAEIKS